MASSDGPRMQVTPREDGGITMRIGSLSLDLERAEAERLHEGIGRVLMPGQPGWPRSRPCCDHCNNLQGDPDGHGYGEIPHDGPCPECAGERARAEREASGE